MNATAIKQRLLLGILLCGLASPLALADGSGPTKRNAADEKNIVVRVAENVVAAGRRLVTPRKLNEFENNDGDCDYINHEVTFGDDQHYTCNTANTRQYVDASFNTFDHAVTVYITDGADCDRDPDSSSFAYYSKLHDDNDRTTSHSNLGPYSGTTCIVFDCNNWIQNCRVRSTIDYTQASSPTPTPTPTPSSPTPTPSSPTPTPTPTAAPSANICGDSGITSRETCDSYCRSNFQFQEVNGVFACTCTVSRFACVSSATPATTSPDSSSSNPPLIRNSAGEQPVVGLVLIITASLAIIAQSL